MGHTGGRRSFWGSYRGCFTEFSEKTFVHGCQHTVEKGRSNVERMLWTLLIMTAIVATIWLLASSYVTFLKAPTATGRSVYRVPISTIPFPAVALCSGTRISREALTNYRDYIFSKQNQTTVKISETREGVYEHLLQLGSFYTLNVDQDDFYLYNRLHSFFIEFYGNPYPLGEIIANLTPPCDDFLKECYWNGVKMDCSTIFNTNWTDYGPCCTFNYQRLTGVEMERISKQGLDIPSPKPLYVKESEFKEGLTVIIEQNSSDQNYNVHSSMASRVLIFNPQDYPDMGSNAYIERQIQLSGEVFIELFPESFKGSQTMRHVSAKARGCYFWDENTLIYKG
ncbi:sodium channel protein Nach-like [Lutzomyia longipalpis]|uniref:sodium channel protein Nach-like n=1 Tax=Lutzomyia longipalpis TaxID=7200 RepID=UPI00248439D2|nr:sodium channel protein Nach-like [Lutzomyia longipalpis]